MSGCEIVCARVYVHVYILFVHVQVRVCVCAMSCVHACLLVCVWMVSAHVHIYNTVYMLKNDVCNMYVHM